MYSSDFLLKNFPIVINRRHRQYPFSLDLGEGGASAVVWVNNHFTSKDIVSQFISGGDFALLGNVIRPCVKMGYTGTHDNAIADVVSAAINRGATWIGLNYEDPSTALIFLQQIEEDAPTIHSNGLYLLAAPTLLKLQTIVGQTSYLSRLLAVSDAILIQTQAHQSNADYTTTIDSVIDTIRTYSTKIPLKFQVSTERPDANVSASSVYSDLRTLVGKTLDAGGMSCWYADSTALIKAANIFSLTERNISSFGHVSGSWVPSAIVSSGTLVEGFENKNDWTVTSASVANDAVHYTQGTQGIKITNSSSSNGTMTKSISISNLATLSTVMSFDLYIDNIDNLSASNTITIYFTSVSNLSKYFSYTITKQYLQTGWNSWTIKQADWSNTGGEDWNNTFIYLRFRIWPASATQVNVTFDNLLGSVTYS